VSGGRARYEDGNVRSATHGIADLAAGPPGGHGSRYAVESPGQAARVPDMRAGANQVLGRECRADLEVLCGGKDSSFAGAGVIARRSCA